MAIRYCYLRDEKKRIVGCVAYRLREDRSAVEFHFSVLNPLDRFDRERARGIATGRLLKSPYWFRVEKDPTNFEMMRDVMSVLSYQHPIAHMLSNYPAEDDIPSRAAKAAKRWLRDSETGDRRVEIEPQEAAP